MLEAKLVVVGSSDNESDVELRLPTKVGRGRDNDITLPHPLVSRQHCEIFDRGNELIVRDLGSMNGTFIGSERITERVLLPGELLTVGTVTFRAVYGGYRADADEDFEPDSGDVLADIPAVSGNGATVIGPAAFSKFPPATADEDTQPAPEPPTLPLPATDSRREIAP